MLFDLFGNERRFLRRRIEVLNHQKRVLQNHLRDVSAARHEAEKQLKELQCLERKDDR